MNMMLGFGNIEHSDMVKFYHVIILAIREQIGNMISVMLSMQLI
jgi:hypothetical protein